MEHAPPFRRQPRGDRPCGGRILSAAHPPASKAAEAAPATEATGAASGSLRRIGAPVSEQSCATVEPGILRQHLAHMRDAPREKGDGDRQDAVERETGKRQEIDVEKCEKKKTPGDRKSVVKGKSVSVREDLGGRR